MKYKPRNSNFAEFQEEIVDDLLEASTRLENVKDAIAKAIDEFVDAIIDGHLEESQFRVWFMDGRLEVDFSLGETTRKDGVLDYFAKSAPLEELLDGFDVGDFYEMGDGEVATAADAADAAAEMFERVAARCRAEAQRIRSVEQKEVEA